MKVFVRTINILLTVFVIVVLVGVAGKVYDDYSFVQYRKEASDYEVELKGGTLTYIGKEYKDLKADEGYDIFKLELQVYNKGNAVQKNDSIFFEYEGESSYVYSVYMEDEYEEPFYYDNMPIIPGRRDGIVEKYVLIDEDEKVIRVKYRNIYSSQYDSETETYFEFEVPRPGDVAL